MNRLSPFSMRSIQTKHNSLTDRSMLFGLSHIYVDALSMTLGIVQ